MKFSILTYNILYNHAFGDLKSIIENYHPDIVCLQEVDTNENNLKKLENYGYRLAEYANSFIKFSKIFGVATFYNHKKIKFLESDVINLPRSIYEFISVILRGGNPRSVLKTDFALKSSKKTITIYNLHLSLYGANSIRNKQLQKTLNEDLNIETKFPLIITGDFNYFPYRRKKLENIMREYGLSEATNNINYTIRYFHQGNIARYNLIQRLGARFIRRFLNGRLKVDYTFYRNLKLIESKRIEVHFSDHFPIICKFEV